MRRARALARDAADRRRIEPEQAPDTHAREQPGFGPVVHPRPAHLEEPSDVVRVPEALSSADRSAGRPAIGGAEEDGRGGVLVDLLPYRPPRRR
jgi:hypothetical protein